MYSFIDRSDRDARDPASPTGRPAPDADRSAAAVRRVGTLAALLLFAAALLGCDEPESTWGSTDSADRTPSTPAEREAAPPPTPDYRRLAAVAGEGRRDRDAGRGEEDVPEQPLPDDVSYPEAESLYHRADYDEAVRHFEAYTREHPDNPWGHYMLGLSAWKAGDLEGAVQGLEGALERDPDHVKSLVNLSRVLLELDRPEEAREPVRKALVQAPRSADVLRVAGNVADESGDTETAIRRYRQALAVDGSDAWSANNLGLLLVRQARFDEARGPLARAVELRPEVGVFRNNLGVALERTGHLDGAREQYRRAADAGHAKAEASLARLEGVSPDGTTGPAEVDVLARRFAERVETWEVDRLARGTSPGEGSGGTSDQAPADEGDVAGEEPDGEPSGGEDGSRPSGPPGPEGDPDPHEGTGDVEPGDPGTDDGTPTDGARPDSTGAGR